MKHSAYIYFLWIAVTVTQAAIAVSMFRHKQHREYPAFFGYTVFHVVQATASLIANFTSYAAFFYIYWGTEAVDAIFTLVVLQEIFSKILNPYSALRGLGTVLSRWAAILLCLFALLSMAFAPGIDKFIRGLLAMERSIQLVQTGLLLFLFLFCKLFGLSWRNHLFGLALGFGIYASTALIAATLLAQFGPTIQAVSGIVLASSYGLGVFIWSYYFLFKKSVEPVGKVPTSGQLHDWNEALAGVLNRSASQPNL